MDGEKTLLVKISHLASQEKTRNSGAAVKITPKRKLSFVTCKDVK